MFYVEQVNRKMNAVGGEGGKRRFSPKSLVDRALEEGLADARSGRTHGPYGSAEAAIAALGSRVKDQKKKGGK
jgi:hypothetical protein